MFRISSWLTRDELRILCFHGVSQDDEHLWHPALFIRPESLRSRLRIISRYRYPVISLDQAVTRLRIGSAPQHGVVITFDDGFYNNYLLAMPMLEEHGFVATLYACSFYIVNQYPEFRSTLQYLLWRASKEQSGPKTLNLAAVLGNSQIHTPHLAEVIDLTDPDSLQRVQRLLFVSGQELATEDHRLALLYRLAAALEINLDDIIRRRIFGYITPQELREMETRGWRAEFHTHLHTVKANNKQLACEIDDNRAALEPIIKRLPTHFCYPSGIGSKDLWRVLVAKDIHSATTCEPGLNSSSTPLYSLYRFLDAEVNSDIEFEAELTGFAEVLRRVVRLARPRKGDEEPGIANDVKWRGAA